MTTITATAAAAQAQVTVATIRTWCRTGVVTAVKTGGRWAIDTASLNHRITIGKDRRVTDRYQVIESINRYGTTVFYVERTDGTENDFRIYSAAYVEREHADVHCTFLNATPADYHIERRHHRTRSMSSGYYWLITGSHPGDSHDLRHTWNDGQEVRGDWAEGTTPVDVLVRIALRHAEGAPERIEKKAQQDAIEAAEAAVREAREEQLAEIRAQKGPLATPRQVDFILQLLDERERSGEGGGFFYGPTDRAGIEELSKGEASAYITSLKGDY